MINQTTGLTEKSCLRLLAGISLRDKKYKEWGQLHPDRMTSPVVQLITEMMIMFRCHLKMR